MISRAVFRKLKSAVGQTFILVMTVTALAAVLGGMAMSSALMSVRMRSLNRASEKNFYLLELAAKEIQLGVGRCAVLDLEEAEGDKGAWLSAFLAERIGIVDESLLYPENTFKMASRRESARQHSGVFLAGFSLTVPTEGELSSSEGRSAVLEVDVGDMAIDGGGLLLSRVELSLVNYERDAKSSIRFDLRIMPEMAGGVEEAAKIENWTRL